MTSSKGNNLANNFQIGFLLSVDIEDLTPSRQEMIEDLMPSRREI